MDIFLHSCIFVRGDFLHSFLRCVYIMCDKPLAGNEALLYGKFKKSLEDIISSSVCGVLFVMVSCYDTVKWCLIELGILLGGVEKLLC